MEQPCLGLARHNCSGGPIWAPPLGTHPLPTISLFPRISQDLRTLGENIEEASLDGMAPAQYGWENVALSWRVRVLGHARVFLKE